MSTPRPLTLTRMAANMLACLPLLGLVAGSANADTRGERLLLPIPQDFRIVARDNNASMGMVSLVPNDQTAQHWSRMVTTRIFRDTKATSFTAYRDEMQRAWKDGCDVVNIDYSSTGATNGYPLQLWVQSCRFRNPQSKPSIAILKMIQGRDQAYVTQVVFRYVPDSAEIAQWSSYLDQMSVCDPRVKGRECPGEGGK